MKWNQIRNGTIKLKLCDLCFSRGKSAFGKAIRWATTGSGEKKSLVNHVFGITGIKKDCLKIDYSIIEALSRVKKTNLFDYDNGIDEVIIIRPLGVTPSEKYYVVLEVEKSLGQIYSPLRIVGQFIDNMIMKILPVEVSFFDRISAPFSKICSVLWSIPLSRIGVKFGASFAGGLDPDEMLDYCLTNPSEFDVVFVSDGLEKLMKK